MYYVIYFVRLIVYSMEFYGIPAAFLNILDSKRFSIGFSGFTMDACNFQCLMSLFFYTVVGTKYLMHFLTNIRNYNTFFQMTEFGVMNVITDNDVPIFKYNSLIDLLLCIRNWSRNLTFCTRVAHIMLMC